MGKLNKRTIGRILKEYRERYGISQLDLCVKAGISQTAVADIERGAITNPRVETLVKLGQALELNSKETADLMRVNIYKEQK